MNQSSQETPCCRKHRNRTMTTAIFLIVPMAFDTSRSSPEMVQRCEKLGVRGFLLDLTRRQTRSQGTEELRPLATTTAHTSESEMCTSPTNSVHSNRNCVLWLPQLHTPANQICARICFAAGRFSRWRATRKHRKRAVPGR